MLVTDLQAALQGVAAVAGPSVAGIGRGWGRGSGVIVAPGQVLTNAHVLRGEAVAVGFAGVAAEGRVLGVDPDLDVAVVGVDTGDRPSIAWDPQAAEVAAIGLPVFALADPGGRGLRVTFGAVSAAGRAFRGPRGRRIGGSLEHTAPLPPGSSGAPLVDGEGRLLGINTVRLEGGFILALPADAALKARVEALARGEAPARPRLGVALAPPRAARAILAAAGVPPRDGLLVRAVLEGSPAALAGIARGDLLVRAGELELRSLDDLFDALDAAGPSLALTVARGAEERTVTAHFSQ